MPLREIVLAGGGHSHVLLLRRWGKNPVPGVQLTLISPGVLTPYSGMLPGYVAGHHSHADMHINLLQLCRWAGVQFVQDCVTGIDTSAKTVTLAAERRLPFELLSLDTGTAPDHTIPGVAEHARPVKPIAGFICHWHQVLALLRAASHSHHIVMVGGGPGSVEVLLAIAHTVDLDPGIACKPRFTLITRRAGILSAYPNPVVDDALACCRQRDIAIITGWHANRVQHGTLHGESKGGETQMNFDHLFWCAGAGAPGWLQQSGLALSPDGFVRVDAHLQSVNCDSVFAAGDIAHFDPAPVPRAGVFAVREAPVLHANLRHALKSERLETFKPQRQFLSLLALGGKQASGNRGRLTFSGRWAWHWKNYLDRKFMKQFRIGDEEVKRGRNAEEKPGD